MFSIQEKKLYNFVYMVMMYTKHFVYVINGTDYSYTLTPAAISQTPFRSFSLSSIFLLSIFSYLSHFHPLYNIVEIINKMLQWEIKSDQHLFSKLHSPLSFLHNKINFNNHFKILLITIYNFFPFEPRKQLMDAQCQRS